MNKSPYNKAIGLPEPEGEGAGILQSLERTEGKRAEQGIPVRAQDLEIVKIREELDALREDLEALRSALGEFKTDEKETDLELRAICNQLAAHLERKHKKPKRESSPAHYVGTS